MWWRGFVYGMIVGGYITSILWMISEYRKNNKHSR